MAFSRGRLATILPLLLRRLQLPIPVGVDLLLTPGEHVPSYTDYWMGHSNGEIQIFAVSGTLSSRKFHLKSQPQICE